MWYIAILVTLLVKGFATIDWSRTSIKKIISRLLLVLGARHEHHSSNSRTPTSTNTIIVTTGKKLWKMRGAYILRDYSRC
ncbi:hypothetical protein F5B19DRAFT_247371 [Rostrohypoxylon terebratum]|nr:hypothetical protein F5B19DRAFT_247371 [Rostrohypoxylon terebratum]